MIGSKKFDTAARILASSRIWLISAGNAAGQRALSAKAQYFLYTLKNGRHGIVLLHREKPLYYIIYAFMPVCHSFGHAVTNCWIF